VLLLTAVASQEGSFICCAEGEGDEGLSETGVLAKSFRANQYTAQADCSHPVVPKERSGEAAQLLTGLHFNA